MSSLELSFSLIQSKARVAARFFPLLLGFLLSPPDSLGKHPPHQGCLAEVEKAAVFIIRKSSVLYRAGFPAVLL
jgi:hypothetical protein